MLTRRVVSCQKDHNAVVLILHAACRAVVQVSKLPESWETSAYCGASNAE